MSAVRKPKAPDFWAWSLDTYLKPVVGDACVNLQDEIGADVNLLLWCCWCAEAGFQPLAPALIAQAVHRVAPVQNGVTGPLRQARRAVKDLVAQSGDQERRFLRAKILDAELDGERIEQAILEALALNEAEPETQPPADRAEAAERARRTARANLALYFAALQQPPEAPQNAQRINSLIAAVF